RAAAVRVRGAPGDAGGAGRACSVWARRDYRIGQGDLKLTHAPARVLDLARLPLLNKRTGGCTAAGAFGSGSHGLRAKKKKATLHGLRFEPVLADMLHRRLINT